MTAPADAVSVLAGPDPTDVGGAHRLVDALVAAGLPHPRKRTVRTDHDDIALSLTLGALEDLDVWAELVDTVGAVADGPWPIAGAHWRVTVGRLAGLRTVLAAEVDEDPPTQDAPRDPATTAAVS